MNPPVSMAPRASRDGRCLIDGCGAGKQTPDHEVRRPLYLTDEEWLWMFARIISPMLVWEMQLFGRRHSFRLVRVAFPLLMFLCLLPPYFSFLDGGAHQTIHSNELSRFAALTWSVCTNVQITAIILIGPLLAANAIVSEKERKTIFYLFATDLTNREIVISKWAIRTLSLLYVVMAGLPVLAFIYLLGGIATEQILVFGAATLAQVAATTAIAIWVSTYAISTRRAMGTALMLSVFLAVGPFVARETLPMLVETVLMKSSMPSSSSLQLVEELLQAACTTSPYYIMNWVDFQSSAGSGVVFAEIAGLYFAMQLGLCVACLGWSTLRVRRVFQKSLERGEGLSGGKTGGRKKIREIGDWPPLLWKEWCFVKPPRRLNLWIARVIVTLLYLPVLFYLGMYLLEGLYGVADEFNYTQTMYAETIASYIAFVTIPCLFVELVSIAMRGATAVSVERDQDQWISILTTSIEPPEIWWGKMAGSLRPFCLRLRIILPAVLLAMFVSESSLFGFPALLIALALSSSLFAAVGIDRSLHCKTTLGSIFATLGILFFLTFLLQLFICIVVVTVGSSSMSGFSSGSLGHRLSQTSGFTLLFSTPWTAIIGSFFFPELSQWMVEEGPYIFLALVLDCVIYSLGIAIFYFRFVGAFDQKSGRTLGSPERSHGFTKDPVSTRRFFSPTDEST